MNAVLFDRGAADQDVIDIHETEVQPTPHFVHEPLARLGGVPEAKRRGDGLVQFERRGDGGLVHVRGLNRNLVEGADEVELGEVPSAMQAGSEVMQMWNRIPVRYRDFVQGAVVATGPPLARHGLGDEVERRGPVTLRRSHHAISQHAVEFAASCGETVGGEAARTSEAGRSGCRDVVSDVVGRRAGAQWAAGHGRKLGPQIAERLVGEAQDARRTAERRRGRQNASGARLASDRAQNTAAHVHHQPVVSGEVGTDDRQRYVSHEETPRVRSAVEHDGVLGVPVRLDGAAVGGGQAGSVGAGGRVDAAVQRELARR